MSEYKIISVESRKGGVGKTTAALNLGYQLRSRYHVLLLDIDITGTSIRTIQESRFWRRDTSLLELDGKPINLLQYFANSYLRGEDLFDFTQNAQELKKVRVSDNGINVIASELYSDDATLLYDPSLLLSTMHVYWLTKLILLVCERFEASFGDEKPCVIILDNSPGFVGIGKAVHDILTDLGPERGKFLTVSSLDIQDLESSLKSVYSLHQEYVNKLNGSRFPDTRKGDEDFYARIQLSGDTEYLYYKQVQAESSLASYQGLIINKVAKNILEGRTRYDYTRFLTGNLKTCYDELFDNQVKDYLVPFDYVLLTQFYGLIEEKGGEAKPNLSTLKKRLNTIEWQVDMLDELGPDTLPYDILRRADGFDKTIDTLKGALIASGYEIIASKFNPKWAPTMPLREMIDVLKEAGLAPESYELYVPRRTRMEQEMTLFKGIASRAIQFAQSQEQEFVWFASAVAAIACELSFCYSNKILWNKRRAGNDVELWRKNQEEWVANVYNALSDWMSSITNEYSIDKGDYLSLTAFVISENAAKYDGVLQEICDYENFVSSLKNAVCHLVDLSTDMRTLVNLIRTITVFNEGSYSLDVDFVPFLDHKIVEKRYTYIEAKEMMHIELRDSDYMAHFREVLNRVIINWGL